MQHALGSFVSKAASRHVAFRRFSAFVPHVRRPSLSARLCCHPSPHFADTRSVTSERRRAGGKRSFSCGSCVQSRVTAHIHPAQVSFSKNTEFLPSQLFHYRLGKYHARAGNTIMEHTLSAVCARLCVCMCVCQDCRYVILYDFCIYTVFN